MQQRASAAAAAAATATATRESAGKHGEPDQERQSLGKRPNQGRRPIREEQHNGCVHDCRGDGESRHPVDGTAAAQRHSGQERHPVQEGLPVGFTQEILRSGQSCETKQRQKQQNEKASHFPQPTF